MQTTKTRIIALSLIIVLLGLVVYQYGYLRIQSEIASIKDAQAVKIETLERYLSLISQKPHLEKRVTLLRKERQSANSRLIKGQTLSLSAATLQNVIKDIVTGKGGTISSERVGKPEDFGKFKIISVSINAVVPDTSALSEIIYAIETHIPYLVVKELDVSVRNYRRPTSELVIKLAISALSAGK